MNTLDLILLILLGGFALFGFWFGIIHMVGAFAGLIIGIWAAGHWQAALAPHLLWATGGNLALANIVAFVMIYSVAARVVGLVFWILEKVFNVIAFIPFLKSFNRLLGAGLGFLEGMVAIGLAMYFAARFPFAAQFTTLMQTSQFASAFMNVGGVFAPLLPATIQTLRSVL
ncbi:MAG: hypothetical protein RLZZ324_946 [Candidatus Parcubacteria bacterium]|jgi:uncharacterized membrane protein required for colicin V production